MRGPPTVFAHSNPADRILFRSKEKFQDRGASSTTAKNWRPHHAPNHCDSAARWFHNGVRQDGERQLPIAGLASPRFSRSVVAEKSLRNKRRRCSSGTTKRTKSS